MPLLGLPNDILLLIGEQIDSEVDISSFTKTNRRLYCALSDLLHVINIKNFDSSALVWGAQRGRLDVVQRMVDLGADVDARDEDISATVWAASNGYADVVRVLLDNGARYRYREGRICTPLCAAAAEGHPEVVRMLLQQDKIATGDQSQYVESESVKVPWSPEGAGIHNRCFLVEGLFVTKGPTAQHHEIEYAIPLFMAIGAGHDATAVVLIESGNVNVNYQDVNHRTPLMWAISHGRHRVITSLLNHGADANIYGPSGDTVLIEAVKNMNGCVLRLLLALESVDVNFPNSQGVTPFQEVVKHSPKQTIRAFLERLDLDLTAAHDEVMAIFRDALNDADEDVVDLILKHGSINPDTRDNNGRTPLSQVAQYGPPTMVRCLLSWGADPTISDIHGRTPHSYAAGAGRHSEFFQLMATQKVALDARDYQGWTPLFWTVKAGDFEMLRLLLWRGADPNARDSEGNTPLLYAARFAQLPDPEISRCGPLIGESSREAVVRALLRYGGDPDVRDRDERTPLSWAFDGGNVRVIQQLLKAKGIVPKQKDFEVLGETEDEGWTLYEWLNEHFGGVWALGKEQLGLQAV
ncbi:ankyrin repeat-containing domain protein [Aspergillus spectabilis]